MPVIGVLALQGAYREHIECFGELRVDAREVRLPSDFIDIDGLVIPGGESTTMTKLMRSYGLADPICNLGMKGAPLIGTCAGAILLGNTETVADVDSLGLIDATIVRNGFGRQQDSFCIDLRIPAMSANPVRGVFIRAPRIESVGDSVQVLASLDDGTIVAAQQGNVLISSFHPELTKDLSFHRYIVDLVNGWKSKRSRVSPTGAKV